MGVGELATVSQICESDTVHKPHPTAAAVRALDHLDVEAAAHALGCRPSYVRRIRERGETPGRRAGSGAEIRLRLPPAVDRRLRARAAGLGVTPAQALTDLAAHALKS